MFVFLRQGAELGCDDQRDVIVCPSKEVVVIGFREDIAEAIAYETMRDMACSGKYLGERADAMLAAHCHISRAEATHAMDKAYARIIYATAKEKDVEQIDWACMYALQEARAHLHLIAAGRLIDEARLKIDGRSE